MQDTPTITVARSFLALLNDDSVPSSRDLARALDQLAMAYHDAPEGHPAEDDRETPTDRYANYKLNYAKLSEKFPDYGYYAIADPTEPVTQEGLVADAVDDLADIAGDLEEVIWRYENLGADDAHWHFRFLFEIHWGMHLRELSLYLHANWLRASDEN